MPIRLTTQFLEQYCKRAPSDLDTPEALKICSVLGPLAQRWLRYEVLEIAGVDPQPPQLPETTPPGQFFILVAATSANRYPLLRPAFVLPLRWCESKSRSQTLPASLLQDADKAVELFAADYGDRTRGSWELRLSPEQDEGFDLSGIDVHAPSARAAMLAALEEAALGVSGIGTVLASVACEHDGITSVGEIDAKLDAAVAFGAKTVFLADSNRDEALRWQARTGGGLCLEFLTARNSLQSSLAPFFQAAHAPPPPDAPLSAHRTYFETCLGKSEHGDGRRDYYLGRLVSLLAADYRRRDPAGPAPGRYTKLVGFVAPKETPPLAFLAHIYRPQAVLLLYDPSQADRAVVALEEHLRTRLGVRRVEKWESDQLGGELQVLRERVQARIREFCGAENGDASGRETVIDLTAGLKRLSFTLLQVAPPQALCVHVDTQRATVFLPRIGTERIEIIRGSG